MLHFPPPSYLAQGQHPLLDSHNTALHHDEVIGHISIVDKSTLLNRKWPDQLHILSLGRMVKQKAQGAQMSLTRGLMLLLDRSYSVEALFFTSFPSFVW